jgi:DNA-directed RNA polymerase subunit RPC12/RpoP
MLQKCDTCGKEVQEVKRVVIRKDYDRSRANPVYNCPECFEKKASKQKESH